MFSAIPKRLLIVLCTTVFIALLGQSIALVALRSSITKSVGDILARERRSYADLFVSSIASDLLLQNYRVIEQQVHTLPPHAGIHAVEFKDNNRKMLLRVKLGKKVSGHTGTQAIDVPLYFDQQQEKRWGSVTLLYDAGHWQQTLQHLSAILWVLTAFSLGLVATLSLLLLRTLSQKFARYQTAAHAIVQNPATSIDDPHLDFAPLASLRNLSAELVEKNAEIAHLSRLAAIGQSTAMLAHDVRKPFSSMRMLLGMMQDGQQSPEFLRRATQEVDAGLSHVEAMIADTLDYSRPYTPTCTAVDVRTLLADSIARAFADTTKRDIRLAYDLQHEGLLYVDGPKVAQVLINILSNAADATPEAGQITVTTRAHEHGILLSIHNTGSFIPKEKREKLFEAFVTEGKANGTGLGLAICKKIVVAHRGRITIESHDATNPARRTMQGEHGESDRETGTAFVMTLPGIAGDGRTDLALPQSVRDCAASPTHREKAPSPNPLPRMGVGFSEAQIATLKILLLDDELVMREGTRLALERAARELQLKEQGVRIEVLTASTAEFAIEIVQEERPQIVFTDLNLSDNPADPTGIDVARRIAALSPEIIVYLLSNANKQSLPENHPFAEVFLKPFSLDDACVFLRTQYGQSLGSDRLAERVSAVTASGPPVPPQTSGIAPLLYALGVKLNHDLRKPYSLIVMSEQLGSESLQDPAFVTELQNSLKKSLEGLKDLGEDLLSYQDGNKAPPEWLGE